MCVSLSRLTCACVCTCEGLFICVCVCVCSCASVCESTLEYSREWEIKKKERDGRPTSNKQVHCPRSKQVSNTRCFNDTPRKRACAHLNEWECELTRVWVWVHASLFVEKERGREEPWGSVVRELSLEFRLQLSTVIRRPER